MSVGVHFEPLVFLTNLSRFCFRSIKKYRNTNPLSDQFKMFTLFVLSGINKHKSTNTNTQTQIQKHKYTNTQTQIHKHKYTSTNTQTQILKHRYTNTNTQTQILKHRYTNTNTQTQIHKQKYTYTNPLVFLPNLKAPSCLFSLLLEPPEALQVCRGFQRLRNSKKMHKNAKICTKNVQQMHKKQQQMQSKLFSVSRDQWCEKLKMQVYHYSLWKGKGRFSKFESVWSVNLPKAHRSFKSEIYVKYITNNKQEICLWKISAIHTLHSDYV